MTPVAWAATGLVGIAVIFALAFLLAPDLFRREPDWGAKRNEAPATPVAPPAPVERREHRHLSITEEQQ